MMGVQFRVILEIQNKNIDIWCNNIGVDGTNVFTMHAI